MKFVGDTGGLPEKMRALAATGHARADDLIREADALEKVLDTDFNVKRIVGTWARARRVWCECTGEPLI
jgi:hypothetical protein